MNYRGEAIYYCEQVNFNLDQAKQIFEADYQFELQTKISKQWI